MISDLIGLAARKSMSEYVKRDLLIMVELKKMDELTKLILQNQQEKLQN